MTDHKELARVIKMALGDRTHLWLKEQSGVSQPTISRLLRGTVATSSKNIKAVARALDLNPNELLTLAGITDEEDDDDLFLDPSARYIARRLTRLPESIRETAIDAVSGVVDGFTSLAGNMEEAAQDLIEEHGVLTGDEEATRLLKLLKRRDPELYDEIMKDLVSPP